MSSQSFEFWFDFSCPYAYLASTQVQAIAERTGATVIPRPMLLGGVFRAVKQHQNLAATLSASKAAHMRDDLRRHAKLWDVALSFPSSHPMRTVDALRALLAAGEADWRLIHALFRAYWVEGLDITNQQVLAQILGTCGYDAAPILMRAEHMEVKDRLRSLTDEAIGLGIFGAPAFVVNGDLLWGQDRMERLEALLTGQGSQEGASEISAPLDFWFDYSSPFAAIASASVEARLGHQARFRPMLLGAVFKAVGMHNVPLFEMSKAKRNWVRRDMLSQAKHAGFALTWPTNFPLKSVLPLRVSLLADPDSPRGRALVHRLFKAYWVEGQDISSAEVVVGLVDEVGLDGDDLIRSASEPDNKVLLNHSTSAAVEAGVFGAPTFVVHHEAGEQSLYWGVDRFDFAVRAAAGDERLH